ncbi:hypothetical protein KP001_07325 [Geomonas subterranea]|uniref:Uncharacterized protein n=1 Tax=Geomonas subterranea TaxID=2847989 RepID=A0ABX8LNW8_9BACT|nr:hypothetical protein [Geomonas subterranea]QXE92324.1 hypothetical protein KP001_07325 [Geomonas subterranea]QXM09577.1 hypothetical protein KP002_00165 [Geomonas subterranea]
MNRDTRIVFINTGRSFFLPYVLHQAKQLNPSSAVVLIGDTGGEDDLIQFEQIENLASDDIDSFRANYVHRSTNPEAFELFCWERWFYLRNFMRKEQADSVLYLDSDVLLYSSLEDIRRCYDGVDWECGLSVPPGGPASGHISYWTREAIEDFCQFAAASFLEGCASQIYDQKWQQHLADGVPGGVCDMTTIELFYQSNRCRILNLAAPYRGNVFDHNINFGDNAEPGEYVVEGGIKKVSFKGGAPFLCRAENGQMDRAHALHFQGSAKRLIRNFYRGGSFRGKARYDMIFLFHSLRLRARVLLDRFARPSV